MPLTHNGVAIQSYLETGPTAALAQGESIKLFSLFYNEEAQANIHFEEIEVSGMRQDVQSLYSTSVRNGKSCMTRFTLQCNRIVPCLLSCQGARYCLKPMRKRVRCLYVPALLPRNVYPGSLRRTLCMVLCYSGLHHVAIRRRDALVGAEENDVIVNGRHHVQNNLVTYNSIDHHTCFAQCVRVGGCHCPQSRYCFDHAVQLCDSAVVGKKTRVWLNVVYQHKSWFFKRFVQWERHLNDL